MNTPALASAPARPPASAPSGSSWAGIIPRRRACGARSDRALAPAAAGRAADGGADRAAGLWQLDRAAQKTALQRLARRARRAAAAARRPNWPAKPRRRGAAPPPRQLQGRWRRRAPVYLDNRQMDGRVGFYVVTPLQLDDGSAVLVQRGWLPRDLQRPHAHRAPHAGRRVQRAGPHRPAAGLGCTSSTRGLGGDPAESRPRRLRARNRLPLRPLSLIQEGTAPAPDDGLLREWPAPASRCAQAPRLCLPVVRAVALTVLYVWFQLIRPRRRAARRDPPWR
jgi:surfeit locus 1 family protein